MTTSDWLPLGHLLAAFTFVSGGVVAGVLHLAATRRDRPSEIALLLGLTRPAFAAVGAGSLLTLGFGLALVEQTGFGFGESWVDASLALWAAAMALTGAGGRPLRHARVFAQRLAADGDRPSDLLHAALADRRVRLLNYLSMAAVVAILVLMVWKPGAA